MDERNQLGRLRNDTDLARRLDEVVRGYRWKRRFDGRTLFGVSNRARDVAHRPRWRPDGHRRLHVVAPHSGPYLRRR